MTGAQKAQRQFQAQSWTVKTEAGDAAKVLDTAVKAGANSSGQISGVQGRQCSWGRRLRSLKRARAQAEQMAQAECKAAHCCTQATRSGGTTASDGRGRLLPYGDG
jgi:uncharacterized protein YggE